MRILGLFARLAVLRRRRIVWLGLLCVTIVFLGSPSLPSGLAGPGALRPTGTLRRDVGDLQTLPTDPTTPSKEAHVDLAVDAPWLYARSSETGELTQSVVSKLLETHAELQRQMLTGQKPLRAIIGRCIFFDLCGGMGDRMFGILTLFMAAIVTNRALLLEHMKPVPQVDYVEPHRLDWRLSSVGDKSVRETLNACLTGVTCSYHNILLPYGKCADLVSIAESSDQVLLMNSNIRTDCVMQMLIAYGILPGSDVPGWNRDDEKQFRIWASFVSHLMLHHLFKFLPNVVDRANNVLSQARLLMNFNDAASLECLLCTHVRSGRGTLENDRHHNVAEFGECAKVVEQHMKEVCPRRPTWFVVSDHPDAPSIVGGSYTQPLSTNGVGPIIHMDRVGFGEVNRDGMSRVFVDFFVLTRCKYFVASLSTFSEVASIWHGPSVQRFDMEHDGVCSVTPKNIHNWQRDVHL